MLSSFTRYLSVGVLNTALHWMVFGAMIVSDVPQSLSNLVAFVAAVTFSFFANARWTFKERATPVRYGLYIAFMGALAATVGWVGDRSNSHPLLTLIVFSICSLGFGFLYSRFIVFRVRP